MERATEKTLQSKICIFALDEVEAEAEAEAEAQAEAEVLQHGSWQLPAAFASCKLQLASC